MRAILSRMFRGNWLGLIYVVVGLFVASNEKHYLDDVDTFKEIVSAVLAVLGWPLVLLGVDLRID